MGRKPKAAAEAELEAATSMPKNTSATFEVGKSEPTAHKNSPSLSVRKKASKTKTMVVRRSGRLNSVRPAQDQAIGSIMEPINLVETEREDEIYFEESEREDAPLVEVTTNEPILGNKGLEEKIDELFKDVEELKSKVRKRNLSSERPSSNLNYRRLYIHSQKKIEAVKNENDQLKNQLQIARSQIEAYENMKDVMDKLKDAIVVSNLAKATEAMVNLSSRAMFTGNFIPSVSGEPNCAAVPETEATRRGSNWNV